MVNWRYERPEGIRGVRKIALISKIQAQILFARDYADLATGTLLKILLWERFSQREEVEDPKQFSSRCLFLVGLHEVRVSPIVAIPSWKNCHSLKLRIVNCAWMRFSLVLPTLSSESKCCRALLAKTLFLCSDLHPYILARYACQRIPANEQHMIANTWYGCQHLSMGHQSSGVLLLASRKITGLVPTVIV